MRRRSGGTTRRGWRLLGLAALLAAELSVAGPALADPDPVDQEIYDPWERYNRAIFGFNDAVNRRFASPLAEAWQWTVPFPIRRGMRNFFVNLAFPIRVLNTTLQLKPVATGHEIGRFVLNTSFGAGGLLDVATHGVGIPMHREDFGQTLGYWGVPEGPYLMLPFFGPSNIREFVGLTADVATSAATFSLIGVSVPFFATFAAQAGNFINSQSFIVDDIKREREQALDFYVSVRNSYLQFRRNRVEDHDLEEEPGESDEDLYYWDEDPLEAE
jgi:phospholipid-binding lipoprotein MlaA